MKNKICWLADPVFVPPAPGGGGPISSLGKAGGITLRKRTKDTGEISVYLGPDSNIEGDLSFSGRARIDGGFRGHVRGTGTLLVGPGARVEADINAVSVVISGEVIGEVNATEKIELKAPGVMRGDITAPLVVMDEGVVFEGHCSMARVEGADNGDKVKLLKAGG